MLSTRGAALRLTLFVAAVVAAPATAQTKLEYKFKEGEKLAYAVEQKMEMEMAIMGQNIQMTMNQTMDMGWSVKSVDKSGKARVTQKIERVRMSMDAPTGKVEYDSKDGKEPNDPIGQAIAGVMKHVAGAEFEVTLDAQGRPSDVTVPTKLAEALKNSPGGQFMSVDSLKQMASQGGLILPEGAVSKGKTWTSDQQVNMQALGKFKSESTMTYDGPADHEGKKVEQIDLKLKMTLSEAANAAIEMKLKDQDSKGKAYFDNSTGRLVGTTMTSTMSMDVSAMGNTFEQKIKQTVTMKLQEKK